LPKIFKDLKSSNVWETLQDHLIFYQKNRHDECDNQDEDSKAQEEECKESKEGKWKIGMEDGEESDDIEEATSDDKGQSPRTRARIS
jgi:hypothetical protein